MTTTTTTTNKTNTTNTMRAWRYDATPVEKHLHFVQDVALPSVGASGILVKVHAMSLNPVDYKLPEMGVLGRVMVGGLPATPGLDFSGTVVEIGSAIPAGVYSIGQEVYGRVDPTNHGTLGEYVVAGYEGCVPLPEGVSHQEASCSGTAGLSAWQAIAPYVKEGDKVFIMGGSGGVGTLAIQMAKALGCHVSVSCSAKNEALCRGLGADEVVDYAKTDVTSWLKSQGRVFKVVVDASPYQAGTYAVANDCLVAEGKFVCVGADPDMTLVKLALKKVLGLAAKVVLFGVKNNHEDLTSIGKLMQEGKLKVQHEVFPSNEAVQALIKLKGKSPGGKIVVDMVM